MDHAINKYLTCQEKTFSEKERFSNEKQLKIIIIFSFKHYSPVTKVVFLKLSHTFLFYLLRNNYIKAFAEEQFEVGFFFT